MRTVAGEAGKHVPERDGVFFFVPPTCYRYGTGERSVPKDGRTEYRETAIALTGLGRDGRAQILAQDAGFNPPDGLALCYHLDRDVAVSELSICVKTASGAPVVSFHPERVLADESERSDGSVPASDTGALLSLHSLEVSAGTHRVVWNWRLPGARLESGALAALVADEGGGEGPRVPPGIYVLELQVGSVVLSRECQLIADPNVNLPLEAYEAQYTLLMRIRDAAVAVNSALRRCTRLAEITRRVAMRSDAPEVVKSAAVEVEKELTAVESRLTQPRWRAKYDCREFPAGLDGRLTTLALAVDKGDAVPTRQATEVAETLFDQVSEAVAALEKVVLGPIAQLNIAASETGMPVLPSAAAI